MQIRGKLLSGALNQLVGGPDLDFADRVMWSLMLLLCNHSRARHNSHDPRRQAFRLAATLKLTCEALR